MNGVECLKYRFKVNYLSNPQQEVLGTRRERVLRVFTKVSVMANAFYYAMKPNNSSVTEHVICMYEASH